MNPSHIMLTGILILSLCISIALCGNALDVKNQLLLVPYPKKVEAKFDSTDTIEVTSALSFTVGDNCDDKCKEFLTDNFNHTITTGLKRQEGLSDFRISLFKQIDLPRPTLNIKGTIASVTIELTGGNKALFFNGEVFPVFKIGVDESYVLTVQTDKIIITAPTVYGARHALETLFQLIRISEDKKFVISQLPITITDEPRFKWRGLMVDPSRNVLSPSIFKKIIDSLASVKANVMHIHLSDGQTFVFETKEYPELSKKAMYDQSKVLTQDFVKELVAYGAKRGVLVYGEVDVPGHTASWNLGYPGVVADSWAAIVERNANYGENVPCLNPANELTWKLLASVLKEVGETFGDYVHVGGDEVRTRAWYESKEYEDIKKWMADNKIDNLEDLEHHFNNVAQKHVIDNGKTPIVWEEVYSHQYADKKSIIHVWFDPRLIKLAVDDGYKVIISAGYYLDRQMPLCVSYDKENTCMNTHSMWVWTNRDMYSYDPVKSFTEEELQNVLGGEGCSWGESVDEQNFFDRVFQRYSAIAERLWSDKSITDPNSHEVRASYLRCLDLRRGLFVGTGPLYHSYCEYKTD